MNSEQQLPDVICRSLARIGDDCPVLSVRLRGETESFSLASKDKSRRELLARVRNGDGDPVELEIDIRAFQQIDGVHNRNFTRFKKSILKKLAKTFKGVPLLRDHEQGSLEARAGTVLKSTPVQVDGGIAFDMTATVTSPWAVEALLAGNLDRFSIGWDYPGLQALLCSECNAEVFTKCSHFPGDVVELDSGETKTVEFVFTEAEGVEVSAVSVPAVKGTGIGEIRSALSKTAAAIAAKKRESRRINKMEKIALALGLSADATEEQILEAQQKRELVHADELSRVREEAETEKGEIAKLRSEVEKYAAAHSQLKVAQLYGAHKDKFPAHRDVDGKEKMHPHAEQILAIAAKDFEAAKGLLESMPSLTASEKVVGKQLYTPEAKDESLSIDPLVSSQLKQLGITEEQFKKFNPINGSAVKGGN